MEFIPVCVGRSSHCPGLLPVERMFGGGGVDADNNAAAGDGDMLKCLQEFPVVGQIAWVVTVRVGMLPDNMTVDCGKNTPIDLIKAYMDSADGNADADDEELKKNYELAMLVLILTNLRILHGHLRWE
eukprot:scaffold40678_cov314-Skeletonema_marinoi.AAC.3